MTVVSNDSSWRPNIDQNIFYSYFVVASCVAVLYNWGLTFGQEVELVWSQRWSMMTVVYLVARYVAIGYSVIKILHTVPTISMTDAGCLIMYKALECMGYVVDIMLSVIMIARLHAMYQRSRKVLIFLVVIFLAIRIAVTVMDAIQLMHVPGEELVLSGNYLCNINLAGDSQFIISMTWILGIVWEALALSLAVWIAVKHFRQLRQHSSGGIIGDCFMILIQTHVNYFASFIVIACLYIGQLSPTLSADGLSLDVHIYYGFTQILHMIQLSVLGPRLILGVREYHAKLVADSDTAMAMTSIVFQERVHVETSCSV